MSNRAYGDELVERVVLDLQFAGVKIKTTVSSGSKFGDCDALTPPGGIALEGKATSTSTSLVCKRTDYLKAYDQAITHGRYPVMVVENSTRDIVIFMPESTIKSLGMADSIKEVEKQFSLISANTTNWSFPKGKQCVVIENKLGEKLVAMDWYSVGLPSLSNCLIELFGEE